MIARTVGALRRALGLRPRPAVEISDAGLYYVEHEILMERERDAYARFAALDDAHLDRTGAGAAWLDAKAALGAFHVALARTRGLGVGGVEVKARALAMVLGGHLDDVDSAVEEALEAAIERAELTHGIHDEVLALSIARDLMAA